MDIVLFGNDIIVDIIYRVVWVIFGNFIFFILLVGFNICICRKIYQFYQYRKKFYFDRFLFQDINFILIIIFIVIVVMFFILVAFFEIVFYIVSMIYSENYRFIEVIMNFM